MQEVWIIIGKTYFVKNSSYTLLSYRAMLRNGDVSFIIMLHMSEWLENTLKLITTKFITHIKNNILSLKLL